MNEMLILLSFSTDQRTAPGGVNSAGGTMAVFLSIAGVDLRIASGVPVGFLMLVFV
ncbi:hypothetical protein [Serratia proteamaculans]|uniref:hypothetical protein n=1 Tax=Serratia proteamaculans TaxID=28151 RepID=UPI001AC1AE67|nr:hypothetical protein [Serratia proteamaculans]MBO1501961.1 hypothetical protein [Serratia proteamaculans]